MPVPRHGAQALTWTLFRHERPQPSMLIHKQLGNDFDYAEISDKFGVGVSTACENVNTAGYRLTSARAHAWCPSTTSGASASARTGCPI